MSAKEWQDFITVLRGMWSTRVVRKTAAEDEDDAKAVKGRHKPGNARQGLAEAQAARELAPAAFALSVKPKPTKKVQPLKGLSANAMRAISLHSPDEANS